ncbi:hypothetical protein BDF20DRAFT_380264 [Mycotypha africana]|uniref:uncharacterized protein n=1 Tax=Mycotypha africana TaxID=64632 RepID=UPI002300449D|nr:uncharacterized protein BDF20DRAFT_380264 [Mycotypha africana]KAI8984340.1 hypothetical protein BDF20DRAFT_380264 [Mycotypha africana]
MAMDSATTSASSNVHSNNQIFNNNGVEKNDSQMSIECTSSIVTTSIIKEGPPSIHNGVSATNVTQNINQQQRPEPSISSNLSSASTLDQLTENSIVEDILKDDHNQDANESIDRLRQRGGEEECKRKFAKMVLAAIRFQNKQDRKPQYTALVFHPVTGNIEKMRVIYSGKAEYHKFCGNAQYLPPELSMITTADKQKEYPQKQQQSDKGYNSEMIDVWVLGIFLYRLLTGRYPFMASNDHQLFKKMIHSDFNVPDYLTEGNFFLFFFCGILPYSIEFVLFIVLSHIQMQRI